MTDKTAPARRLGDLLAHAHGNDADAQYDLALACMRSGEPTASRIEAYFWLTLCAHVQGHTWQPDPDSLRERLASEMTGHEVFVAQRRAEIWIERNGVSTASDDA